ncbi:MAG: YncE family protein [Marinicellaceae bacterium]
MKILVVLFLSFNLYATDVPYVNWENHPVHAIDISPDKSKMAVAHTADNRVQLFDISLSYPTRLGHVKVGVDPVSVRFKDNNEIWVVNHISDSISIVDFTSRKVKATLQTSDEPFDVVFANNKAYVSCSQVNQILIYDLNNLQSSPTVIDVMAEDPRSMVVNNDGSKVYIASFESGNKTTILAGGIDETEGTLTFPNNPVNRDLSPYNGQNPPPNDGNGFLPAMNPDLPTPPKVSLIVKQDQNGIWRDDNGEDWTHMITGSQAHLSGRIPGWKLLDHDITVIDTSTNQVSYVSGLMNIGMALGFNSSKNELTLVGTDAINEVRFEPILNGIFVRANLGIVAENSLDNPRIQDLNPHLDYLSSHVDQSIRDQSIGDPRGIVWRSDGNTGFISGMGSNNIIVIDSQGNRLNRIEVGEGATGLALDETNNRLYVWNHFEASISTVDLTSQSEILKTQLFNPLPESIKQGRKFLYGTHETSGLGQAACASCHVDARMDKLSWDLGDPSGEVKEFNQNCQTANPVIANFGCDDFHPMKGPMMTQTFQDIIGNEPFHWRGDRDGIEEFNGAFVSINGDDALLTAQEMQQFKDMLATVTFPPNPFRNLDNTLPENIELTHHYTSGRFSPAGQPLGSGNPQNGLQLFNLGLLDNVFQCGSCHTIPTGMAVNGPLKLGVLNASVGGEIMPLGANDANHLGIVSVDGSTQKSIKTPQLRNMHEKVGFETSRSESLQGFGFLHDGAVDSISRFLSAGAFGVDSDQEVADLVALMMAFSGSELDDGNIPFGNDPEESLDTHAGVGKQFTLTQATQLNSSIDEMVSIASSGKVDLTVDAIQNTYLFDPTLDKFVDKNSQQISPMGLMSIASEESPLSYTLVPKGLGNRLAFDRDGDGIKDDIEIFNGSNPADAISTGIHPKRGLWYNPDRSGHGADVQISGNNLYMLWYAYKEDKTPIWYLASGPYSEDWQADLYSFTWDFDNRTTKGNIVGSVNLKFNHAKSANFTWNVDGRTGSEPFVYLDVSNEDTTKQFTGTYYDANDSGWGLTVHAQGPSQVVVLYYYDENGLPRWSLGSAENNQNSIIEMSSFTGFCPDCAYEFPTSEINGSVNLEFLLNSKIQFDSAISFPGDSSDWNLNNISLSELSSEYFDPAVQ